MDVHRRTWACPDAAKVAGRDSLSDSGSSHHDEAVPCQWDAHARDSEMVRSPAVSPIRR